jgi:hypothetical protein
MSRPRGYAEQAAKDNFSKELKKKMIDFDIKSVKALSELTADIEPRTLQRRLGNIGDLTISELAQLVPILDPDPFLLLRCCGFSARNISKIKERNT